LVKNPMSFSSASATNALNTPITVASKVMGITCQVVVKSPSCCARSVGWLASNHDLSLVPKSCVGSSHGPSAPPVVLRTGGLAKSAAEDSLAPSCDFMKHRSQYRSHPT
jgi:hypothetical protein